MYMYIGYALIIETKIGADFDAYIKTNNGQLNQYS